MSSVVISGNTSGAVTLTVPDVAGTNTATLPASTGTVMVSGNMPTFSYYQSIQQTIPASTATKITFTSSEWDTTSGMYASSRFTPTVAGYYQINAGFASSTGTGRYYIYVYKNGAAYKSGVDSPTMYAPIVSALVYCNGSTDYVEIYGYSSAGDSFIATAPRTYFQGAMVRGA